MEMSHLVSKLKALKLELSNDLFVHLVLISFLHNSINLSQLQPIKSKVDT